MRTLIIADVTSNHGGDLDLARRFIRTAAECGADYIKFQSWRACKVRLSDPQKAWFEKAELKDEDHRILIEECKRHEIGFLTTIFDIERIEFLASLGIDTIKVPSPDAASYTMLAALRQRFKNIIVSVGMATEQEIKKTTELLRSGRFSLLHCVSLYPVPDDLANVRKMLALRDFAESVGYSDHTVGNDAAKLAIALGAAYVEKHFCLSRDGTLGRSNPWDMTPDDLREICGFSQRAEQLLGDGSLIVSAQELENRPRFVGRWGDNR